jgi:hypothetical protein
MENKIGKLNADDAMKAELKDCEYIEIDDVVFIRKDKALDLCNRAHAAQNRKREALQLHGVVGRSEQLPCKHEHIDRRDGCDECLDCGARNF